MPAPDANKIKAAMLTCYKLINKVVDRNSCTVRKVKGKV